MAYRKAVKHISNLIASELGGDTTLLQYKHVDLSSILKFGGKRKPSRSDCQPSAENMEQLVALIKEIVEETGMFVCRHKAIHYPKSELFLQQGVIRSNCIDCLDRTNSFQLIVAKELVKRQLRALEILADNVFPKDDSNLLEIVTQLYESVGDVISLQYAGSKAHKRSTSMLTDIFTSAKRYFSNAISDSNKQKRINLFLGAVQPSDKCKDDDYLLMPIAKAPAPNLPTTFR
eukprot:TRINITY_DN7524_c0_g2_i1.p1 TRINITY_DN7524_c0_g2~~TRINITY_DN7524_c0_g2_i1.p1  ORF type:complete len:232 (-),score=75.81 TRINITY_DN7524_c0_g2_i1:588-1283(-)